MAVIEAWQGENVTMVEIGRDPRFVLVRKK